LFLFLFLSLLFEKGEEKSLDSGNREKKLLVDTDFFHEKDILGVNGFYLIGGVLLGYSLAFSLSGKVNPSLGKFLNSSWFLLSISDFEVI
jgi:hypothetical protein